VLVLGHLGIGQAISAPLARGLPLGWLLVGLVFPDLIDKPLYYGLSAWSGLAGAELGQAFWPVSGTRTFGHTGLFALGLGLLGFGRRSRALMALGLGCAVHLLLDQTAELWRPALPRLQAADQPTLLNAVLYPLLGGGFPVSPHQNLGEHLSLAAQPGLWVPELLGAALLGWRLWARKHAPELMERLRAARLRRGLSRSRRQERVRSRH
jgi:hypothetical protein